MSAPEWIAAIGTASATLLAAGALVAQQRDRRRAPAEQVTGWLELREQEPITVVLRNAGTLPAYDVIARGVFHPGRRTGTVTVETVLPPGESRRTSQERYDPDHEDADFRPSVSLRFKDAAGRAWHRNEHGTLGRLTGGYHVTAEFVAALDEIDGVRE